MSELQHVVHGVSLVDGSHPGDRTEHLPRATDASHHVDVSIIVPLLNEAESLPQLYQEIVGAISALRLGMGDGQAEHRDWSYEIIFVDDGSTDDSIDVLKSLTKADPHIQVIQFRRNFGKSAALAAGFEVARGTYVITLDADLQDVPAEIPTLLAPIVRDEADLVSGWKALRQDPISKTLPSSIFNFVVRRVSGVPLHDFNCGFKAYRHDVIDEIQLYGELHRYIPVLAHFRGFRVMETAVPHRARRYGRSKFGPARFIRGFFDLLTVFFLTQYTRRPLHLFGLGGLLIAAVGFVIGLYLAGIKLVLGEPIGHRPLLILAVLLIIVGSQFVMFGLLGEMIAHYARAPERVHDYAVRRVIRHGK